MRNRTEENRLYAKRHPEKVRIRNIVTHAIRDGLLTMAKREYCVDCGKKAARWDHYMGYTVQHALTVEPVCVVCCTKREIKRGTYERHPSAKGHLASKVS